MIPVVHQQHPLPAHVEVAVYWIVLAPRDEYADHAVRILRARMGVMPVGAGLLDRDIEEKRLAGRDWVLHGGQYRESKRVKKDSWGGGGER